MIFFRPILSSFERRLARIHKQAIILATDAFVVPIVFLLTVMLINGSFWPQHVIRPLLPLLPVLAVLGGISSFLAGLHRVQLKTYVSLSSNGIGTFSLMSGLGAFILTLAAGIDFPVFGTISFTMGVFWAALFVRVQMLRVLLWVLAEGKLRTNVLIYGAGRTGMQLASALSAHEAIQVVAFIDDDLTLHSQKLMGKHIYPARQIERLIRKYNIGRVLLAMPSLSAPKLAQITRTLQALGLSVQVLPSFAQLIGTEELVENLRTVTADSLLGRSQLDESLRGAIQSFAGRSVLVTGAGGSIGSELCRQLVAQEPERLVLYDVSEPALYTIDRELRELGQDFRTKIIPVLGSVTDARMARLVLAQHGIDTVFHAAAYKHVPLVELNPVAGIANNVFGTRTMADACVEEGVARFILVSTDKAVRPTNVMGASKRLAELVVQDRAKRSPRTRFSIVRFGNVLGSSGSVIPLFRDQIARGGPVTLTHEDVTRYFMTISEAAKLVLTAGSFKEPADQSSNPAPVTPDVFVLDMGKPVRIRQLAEQMIHGAGLTVKSEENPNGDIEIVVIGLRKGEKLHEELLIGQGLLTTPHPKILRASEESLPELEMAHALRTLGGFMATGEAEAARDMAMELVRPRGERMEAAAQAT